MTMFAPEHRITGGEFGWNRGRDMKNEQKTASFRQKHGKNADFPMLKRYFWVAFSFPESLIGLAFGTSAGLRFAVGNYRTQFFAFFGGNGDGEEVG